MRLVLIEWIDSCGCAASWQQFEDGDYPEPMICQSVGWLYRDDENCKVIIPHTGIFSNSSIEPTQRCGDMAIPTVCVRRMYDLVAAKKSNIQKEAENGASNANKVDTSD